MRQGSFIQSFDDYAHIVSYAVKSGRRVWSGDFLHKDDSSGSARRKAQRNLRLLEKAGYLISDDRMPKGYLATEKAKQLFGVTS